MDFTTFQFHLTDVTDPVVTAYLHQFNNHFDVPDDGPYSYHIVQSFLTKMVATNQLDPTHTELGLFGKTRKELKRLFNQKLRNKVIYEIDAKMTDSIAEYFNQLGLQMHNNFGWAMAVYNSQTDENKIYFIMQANLNPQLFKKVINYTVFGGFDGNQSIDNFLKTV